MNLSKKHKAKILAAYLRKSISKKEMEYLLKHGMAIAPGEWVYANEEERKQQEEKRELISRVFSHKISRIEWIFIN